MSSLEVYKPPELLSEAHERENANRFLTLFEHRVTVHEIN